MTARSTAPVRIIINADDLGTSTHVNKVIFDFLSRNLITSSTLLANAPAFDDAVQRIREYKKNSFGVHLNITQYKPITTSRYLKPLLDDHGCLCGNIFNISLNKAVQQAVYEEWDAQVEKILSTGICLSHLDSHQHVHTLPQLFFPLKKIQKKYRLRKVRLTKNLYSNSLPLSSSLLKWKKLLWNKMLQGYYTTRTTAVFTDFSSFHEIITSSSCCFSTVELMTHPGSPVCAQENELLQTAWINKLSCKVDLIDYHTL